MILHSLRMRRNVSRQSYDALRRMDFPIKLRNKRHTMNDVFGLAGWTSFEFVHHVFAHWDSSNPVFSI